MVAKWTASALLAALFLMSALTPMLTATPARGDVDRAGVGSRNGPLTADDARVQFAILTSPLFVDQFQKLADWKTDKGVYAKVYTTDFATNNYPGRDSREQYHAFLVDLYNWTHGGLKYLLIGGDDQFIRAREIWTGVKQGWAYSGQWAYSDHYYAGLSSNWDANGNGRYGELGEEDWDAEISVGRLPVDDAAQAGAVVDKILAYERSPEVGPWMSTAFVAASVMNPPNGNATNEANPDYIYNWWEDNAWKSAQRTIPLIPGYMDKTILYDYNQTYGGNYTPENDTLNHTSYVGALNAGAAIVASITHGYIPTGNGVPQYSGDGIDYNWTHLFYSSNNASLDDIRYLQNGNRTPFIYFSSCYDGNFTELNDSNFERLVTLAPGGAIGIIAPTENTYRGEEIVGISDGNWWMSEDFWSHLLGGMPRAGDAYYQMVRDYVPHLRAVGSNPDVPYYRQNLATYNLLGDPEMPVWLDVPRAMHLVLPQYVYDLSYDVPVRVMSGTAPVAGARVCFNGEDFYAYADTNATGWAVLHVDPNAEGQSVKVTATAPQYLPLQQTMGITPSPAELLLVPGSVHAGSARPEAGEPTQLGAEVRNIGHTDAPSFSVQFYDGDPAHGGAPIGSPTDIAGLPAGASTPVFATWASPTAGWHTIWVVADSQGEVPEVIKENNAGNVTIYVSELNAAVRQIKVHGGPPSGAVPLGKESTIDVEVASTGPAALPPIKVRLYLGDPGAGGVQVGGEMVTPTIPASGFRTVSFPFTPQATGRFKLVAVADPTDEVAEFDESDNTASLWVKVAQMPFWDPIPAVKMVEDVEKQLDLTRWVHDYDTDLRNLTLSVVSVSTDRAELLVSGLVLTISTDPDWYGEFDIEVQVTDGDFTVPTGFHVVVESRNDAPRFRNTEHNATLQEGMPWHFALDAYDPDGDLITYSDNSGLFDVSPQGVVDWTPTFEEIRLSPILVVRFIATDGTDQTYYAMTLTLVANNTPPVLTLPSELVLERGKEFRYTVRATDREGDALHYFVNFTSGKPLFDIIPTTGQIGFTPTLGMVGDHNVTVLVSDGVNTVNGTMMLEVVDTSQAGGVSMVVEYAVLAFELAIVVVGLLYIVYYRQRESREAAQREAALNKAEVKLSDAKGDAEDVSEGGKVAPEAKAPVLREESIEDDDED